MLFWNSYRFLILSPASQTAASSTSRSKPNGNGGPATGQVALLMIDVDCFKGVNDIHGHAYGDECLFIIGQTLHKTMMRATDLVARYGGEEFIVLLAIQISATPLWWLNGSGAVNQLDISMNRRPLDSGSR